MQGSRVCKSPCGRGREHNSGVQGERGRACHHGQGTAGGAGERGRAMLRAAQSSSSPNAPSFCVQDRGSELGSVMRGFPNLLKPLGGRERGPGRGWGLRGGRVEGKRGLALVFLWTDMGTGWGQGGGDGLYQGCLLPWGN